MRDMAERRGVALQTEAETGCVLHGDERAIRQIMPNLIPNATKFTPSGGAVVPKSLAELHGGRLDIESEKGRGTIVKVWLPLIEALTPSARRNAVRAVG